MTEWREVTLGDVLTLQRGFDLPARDRVDGPYPIVSSSGVTGRHAAAKVEPPGVVIGRYGSLGSVHWITMPYWPLNTALWVKDFKGNDPRYLSYLLRTIAVDGSSASAVPGVNRNHLHRLPVRVPPTAVQRCISGVLAAFDELIEINERRIELLEDLARSLYREWFVRFRFPGESAQGPVSSGIPAGWSTKALSELTSQLSRGIAPKYAENGDWIVLNQRCVRGGRVSLARARRHGGTVREAKQIRQGDIVVNSTGVGTLGRVGMFVVPADRVTADSHMTIVRPATQPMQTWLGLALMERQPDLESMGAGSTGQTELGRDRLGSLQLVVPPDGVLTRFSRVGRPLLTRAHALSVANAAYARTRDLLLPRLVTGRLDISDVSLGPLVTDTETG